MTQAIALNRSTLAPFRPLYNHFCQVAKTDYRWDIDPIDYDTLSVALDQGILMGLGVTDPASNAPLGFMLYRLEPHKAIEINVIYLVPEAEPKTALDRLMRRFVEEVKQLRDWDVISYAMLGKQESLIRTITWYGFQPMGQAVLQFDLQNPLTIQILMQQKPKPLPEGYSLDHWQPKYAEGVAETLYEAFSKAADALWDPRFRSLPGTQGIVSMLTTGEMGTHLPRCTTVLLKEGVPVGVCFMLEAKLGVGNIPLVGVRPSEKGKGFGTLLLKSTLDNTIKAILDGQVGLFEITATMETDNFSAIKMYRRVGFTEEYNYPHVYLEHSRLKTLKVGQWCAEGGGMADSTAEGNPS
jgi:GNAT superfamily N-acetyltransferase